MATAVPPFSLTPAQQLIWLAFFVILVGPAVYLLILRNSPRCRACKGTGKVEVGTDAKSVDCPTCAGTGYKPGS